MKIIRNHVGRSWAIDGGSWSVPLQEVGLPVQIPPELLWNVRTRCIRPVRAIYVASTAYRMLRTCCCCHLVPHVLVLCRVTLLSSTPLFHFSIGLMVFGMFNDSKRRSTLSCCPKAPLVALSRMWAFTDWHVPSPQSPQRTSSVPRRTTSVASASWMRSPRAGRQSGTSRT